MARSSTKPVLYARGDVPDTLNRDLSRCYPEAAIFAFRIDRDHPDGWLGPLSVRRRGALTVDPC